jgi:O-antigen/teichoic acid export membrane protein
VTVPDAVTDAIDPAPSFVGSFFRHGATYALGGILSQGIAFLLFPFFAHVFVPRDYGIIDLVGLTMTLVNLTIALEISQGLGRYFAEATEFEERKAYASTAFTFTALIYTAALVVALIVIRPLTTLVLGGDVDKAIMRLAVVAMWCSGMLYLTQDLLRWQLRPKAFAVVSVVTAAMTAGTSVVLVIGFDTGVIGAIVGQVVGFGVGGALAYRLSSDLFRLRFDRAKFGRMLAYSIPLVPASVGVFLNGYADRIAIRSKLTLSDVGVYGVGYRLSMVVSLTLIGFQGALMPFTLSRHEQPQTRQDLARIFRLFCAIALAVFLCLSLFADELLRLLTRPAYYGATTVVPLLVAASFFGGMYIFAPGLSIAKKTRPYAVITLVAGLANLALAFSLVGPLGIRGPALAFLVACAGSFAALMLLSQRHFHVPHEWRRLLLTSSAVAGLVAVGRMFLGGTDDPFITLAKISLAAFALSLIGALLLTREELVGLARFPPRAARALRSFPKPARSPRA